MCQKNANHDQSSSNVPLGTSEQNLSRGGAPQRSYFMASPLCITMYEGQHELAPTRTIGGGWELGGAQCNESTNRSSVGLVKNYVKFG